MKTTNFENSKKLHELGFQAKTDFWWKDKNYYSYRVYSNDTDDIGDNYPAYDLETILEAFPKTLILDEREAFNHGKLKIFFDVDGENYIGYQNFDGFHLEFNLLQENESLADTAARLLILLAQQKIIQI